MTLRLFNALFLLLIGAKMSVEAYGCCGCGCCNCCHCSPCCNCCPCTNPPLLIKLPPTPPKLCCCCGCCCRPCCCCPCCCGGRKRRSTPTPLEKKCMKTMKKQTTVCTNATRNCKRCANLPKLEQKMPKVAVTVSNSTPKDKKPKLRARRQVEMLGQMFGKSMGLLPSQRYFGQKLGNTNGCDCKC